MFDILVVVFETKRAQTQSLEYDSMLSFYTDSSVNCFVDCVFRSFFFLRYSDIFVYCGLWL